MTTWIIAYILSGALSAGVSAHRLHQGCREANPLMPSRPVWNVTAKVGTTIGISFAIGHVSHDHPKAARWLVVESIGVNVGSTIHDAQARCR